MKKLNAGIRLSLKMMGFNLQVNKRQDLLFDFSCTWDRTNKKYAFILVDKFDYHKIQKDDAYKSTINFCKTHNLSIIIISKKDKNLMETDHLKIIPHKDLEKIFSTFKSI